jgi:hypothetical protein
MVQLCYSETPEATNAPTSCGNLFCDCYEKICGLGTAHAMNFGRTILILKYS